MDKSLSRLINLDLLRLASALMVVAAHYGFRMGISGEGGSVSFPELAPVSVWFEGGIFLFFMISGYVISMSANGRTARQFFISRMARVWPTFFACATITAIVVTFWPVPGHAQPTIAQWLAHLVIASRLLGQPFIDGAYWTIVYELAFYAWVFVLLAGGLFEKRWRAVIVAWLAISVLNEIFIGSTLMERLFITRYSGCFMFGWVLYHQQKLPTRSGLTLFVLTAMWAITTPILMEPQIQQLYGLSRSWPVLILLGSVSAAIMVAAVYGRSVPLNTQVVALLAGLTYPLYLLHQNIGYAIFNRFGEGLGRWWSLVLVLAVITALAWIVAQHLEPFCRPYLQKFLTAATQTRIKVRRNQAPLKPA